MSAPSSGMHSATAMEVAREMGLSMGRPNLEVFAETLLEEARRNPDIRRRGSYHQTASRTCTSREQGVRQRRFRVPQDHG